MPETRSLQEAVGLQYYSPVTKARYAPPREVTWNMLTATEKRIATFIVEGDYAAALQLAPENAVDKNYDPEKVAAILNASGIENGAFFTNNIVQLVLRR